MANEIYGNLKGIRNSVIEELKTFYDIRLEGGQLLTSELALRMADVTDFINREVSVYVARNGQVLAPLYRIRTDERHYLAVRRRVENMYAEQGRYHYSILGAALCKLDIAHERAEHYFCSQFVAEVLSRCGVIRLPKSASLMRPADFARLPELEKIYSGPILYAPGAEEMFMKGASNGQPGEARAV